MKVLALLLMPGLAFAGDRLSYLTVSQDNHYTGVSAVVCKIAASRLTKGLTYSGQMTFEWKTTNPSMVGFTSVVPFEVSGAAPTYTDAGYGITATLVGGRVLAVLDVGVPLTPGDVLTCNAHIDLGPLAAPVGTIYQSDLNYTEHPPQ